MPIDAYSLCPGGTGKKIKFCCADFVPELEKIFRMLEGEQHLACLRHIEHLQERGEQRACLLAIKGELLRLTDQFEAAEANAAAFLERFPDNSLAWAEAAILTAVSQGGRPALDKLQRAVALADGQMQPRLYEALGIVAEILIHEEDWLAGRALLHLQLALTQDDQRPMTLLMRLNRSESIPLLMKSERPLGTAAEVAGNDRLQAALAPLAQARWQEAEEKLATLAQESPEAAAVWRSLAMVRTWLADDEGAILALRKFAVLAAPSEDAVEAEALAMMLDDNPLGDSLDLLRLTWTVRDAERLQEALLSDRRVMQVPFNPADLAGEDAPPPRAIFSLLDRPLAENGAGLSLHTVPRLICQALLFGKQTDREARFEAIGLSAADRELATRLLGEIGGEAIAADPAAEVIGKTSASHHLLLRQWQMPRDVSREQFDALVREHRQEALLEKWPSLPLGILDGKSPSEAAADPALHVRLLAAILLLEHWQEHGAAAYDFNQLRSRLGLPLLEPIDAVDAAGVEQLPLVRLSRVSLENLSDEALGAALRRALMFAAREAMRKFAQAIVDRPSFADRPEQTRAYSVLAQTAENFEQALAHLEQGRKAAEVAGRSCAAWDLMELPLRFGRGEVREAQRLIQHLQQRHLREPGVAEAVTQILVEVGVLRPDGTPAHPMGGREPPPGAVPQEPAAAPGKIWTPGSEESGGGKLWTPE
ncbi:MAG: hypothetical protein ABSG68_11715 [Thermoguttaceae bacterium]|jgi:hypothetical protein